MKNSNLHIQVRRQKSHRAFILSLSYILAASKRETKAEHHRGTRAALEKEIRDAEDGRERKRACGLKSRARCAGKRKSLRERRKFRGGKREGGYVEKKRKNS